jgi:hypothetical protein
MADGGWQLSMKRIDAEFDIPQFLASSLVRRIAANDFCLSPTDRDRFAKFPDEVIARIVQIVRDSYLEAGEDIGGEILREHLRQQALDSRRAMIANGELLSETDFRQRLGVSELRLEILELGGRVFAMLIDGVQYFPALLADPTRNLSRLQAICRIILPTPADSRLDFLASRHGSLGDRRPIDMLDDDEDFESLKHLATAWAAEWWRTTVRMYDGEHSVEPTRLEPLYTAAVEVDARRPLWQRASQALQAPGYEWPLGPYAEIRLFTLFVELQAAGDAPLNKEACVQIAVDGDYIHVHIVTAPGRVLASSRVPAGKRRTLLDVAKRVLAHLSK